MRRTRRKASTEKEYDDNGSSCSTPPAKNKENFFSCVGERPSFGDDQQQQIIALRKDYDQNGKQVECYLLPNMCMISNRARSIYVIHFLCDSCNDH